MRFFDLLSSEAVRVDLAAADKHDLMRQLAALLAGPDDAAQALAALEAREHLGTTGLGHGVAIPHGRSRDIETARAAFVRLDPPLDFGAEDGQPVDLVAALIVPAHFTNEHLELLAELAELLSDNTEVTKLRSAADVDALHAELMQWAAS